MTDPIPHRTAFPSEEAAAAALARLPSFPDRRYAVVPIQQIAGAGLCEAYAIAAFTHALDFLGYVAPEEAAPEQLALVLEAGRGSRRRPARRHPPFFDLLDDEAFLGVLLSLTMPRPTARKAAARLIGQFGSCAAVLSTSSLDLTRAEIPAAARDALALVRAAVLRMTRQRARERPVLSSWDAVVDYCRVRLAHLPTETLHLLFLDRRNGLIADETQQRGSIDHTPVYPREVAKRALELNAAALLMLHNHPSGDPTPSHADIEMTRQVRDALKTLGITLHDHMIVAAGGNASLRQLGLL